MHINKITTVVSLFLFILVNSNILLASETIVPVYGLLFPTNVGLSIAQKQFIKVAGYPQRFIKTFDTDGGRRRINETWGYSADGLVESFINGYHVQEDDLSFLDPSLAPGHLHPEDYQFDNTPAEIVDIHGLPNKIFEDQIWNGSLLVYIYDNIVFSFNNDLLRTVVYCSY